MVNCVNPYAVLYHGMQDLLPCNSTQDVALVLKTSGEGINRCQYNVPTGSNIAMVIPVENESQPLNKNIVIYKNKDRHPGKNNLMLMDDKNPMYDPLLYVLMFPYGDKGGSSSATAHNSNIMHTSSWSIQGTHLTLSIEWAVCSNNTLLICIPRLRQLSLHM